MKNIFKALKLSSGRDFGIVREIFQCTNRNKTKGYGRFPGEAENILGFEPELLQMPLGTLTVGAVDEAREKCKDEESFSKAHDIFL